ncbi:hypothetical protein B0T16DRAFT_450324 [Cercophora newfieldiana]|uniref:Uncharacterized protein n=1 Tax=Cercophora newfieldiana TaxID=92897 RepID=A0AA39XT14_9PEZI|nr:hypothetical protein B0T16DRAFT_450324 [Cercophora newfieldiana]
MLKDQPASKSSSSGSAFSSTAPKLRTSPLPYSLTITMTRHGLLLLAALAVSSGVTPAQARPSAQPSTMARSEPNADCLTLSDHPSWEITNIQLTTGNLLSGPYFSAQVRNYAAASPDTYFSCQAALKSGATVGPQLLACSAPLQGGTKYPTRIAATYDVATSRFTIDETWASTTLDLPCAPVISSREDPNLVVACAHMTPFSFPGTLVSQSPVSGP